MYEGFGDWVIARRLELGMTQTELWRELEARELELTIAAVWKWEHGKARPTGPHLEVLLDALRVTDRVARVQVAKALDGWAQYPVLS